MTNTKAIYFDMDGTIADLYSVEGWLPMLRAHNATPYTQAKTLVNMSGICSVSYISKIENGKIIPKYSVLKELCEEQGITSEELDTLLNVDKLIEQTVETLFWNDRNKIGEIYSKVYTFDNYKVSFIKIIYEMMYYHYNIVECFRNLA